MDEDRRLAVYWLCVIIFSVLTAVLIGSWIILGDKYKIPTFSMVALMSYSLYNTIFDELEKLWPFIGLIVITVILNLYIFFKEFKFKYILSRYNLQEGEKQYEDKEIYGIF